MCFRAGVPGTHRSWVTQESPTVSTLDLGSNRLIKDRTQTRRKRERESFEQIRYSALPCFIIMTSAQSTLVYHYPFSKFLSCLAIISSKPQWAYYCQGKVLIAVKKGGQCISHKVIVKKKRLFHKVNFILHLKTVYPPPPKNYNKRNILFCWN